MVYDLIVIGGGPAGYLAAERAGHAGLKTLLIEKRFIGGVCLNEGCVPSKTLLHSAKIYDYARYSEKYGVTCENVKFDHAKVIKRKEKVVKMLTGGIEALLKKNKVTIVEGVCSIAGKHAEGFEVAAEDKTFIGKRILVATGSMPAVPPIPGLKEGLESGYVMTNREILDIDHVPEKLVIVGGGVIGLEMASYFNSAGSDVTVIEMLDHIGGYTDLEIANFLLKEYTNKGVNFKLNAKVTQIKEGSVVYETAEGSQEALADHVLLSIGRRPVTTGIGLEKIGVELERGSVKVDSVGQTNVACVYAAGDVNGKSMLAHTAYREAEVCIDHMLGKKDIMRYHAVPSVIYTNPEVSSVGETEETAKEKGIDYTIANISMKYSGRFVAENEGGDGICKVLVDKEHQRLIGVHMIGSYASEIIYGAALMIETEMRVDDIKELVFPHPTVCEVIREAIFQV